MLESRDSENSLNNSNQDDEKLIGNYIIGKTIGEGTFGKVKVARHIPTKEKVALKILEREKLKEKEDLEHIENEINVLKLVKHPNITQLYEVIETEDKIFIIMEYAEKGDLFDYISKKSCLSEPESNKYFQQIISALEYLHKLKIVHRDIKPENMMLDYKYCIKITDFGLSKKYSEKTLLSTPCGTPSYAPPEMLDGEKYHGMFSDIWSAGIVLFAMISGYLPFDDTDENLLHKHIIKGNIEYPDFISENVKDLLKRILNTNPKERYDFEQIKSHPWFNLNNSLDMRVFGFNINDYILPIDENIIEEIEKLYDEEKELLKIFLLNNEYNEFTATYFLLLKKIIREGGTSVSDYFSNDFLNYIRNPDNLKPVLLTEFHSMQTEGHNQTLINQKPEIPDNNPIISNDLEINHEDSEIHNKSREINVSKHEDLLSFHNNRSFSLLNDTDYPRRINDFDYKPGRRTNLKRNDNFIKDRQEYIKRDSSDGIIYKRKKSLRILHNLFSLNLNKEQFLIFSEKENKSRKHTKCISSVAVFETMENTSMLELGLNNLNTTENVNLNCDSNRTVAVNNTIDRIKLTFENEFKNNFMKNISYFSKKNNHNPKQRNKKNLFQETFSSFNNSSNLTPNKAFNVSSTQTIKNEKHLRIASLQFMEKSDKTCLTSVREEVTTGGLSKSCKKKSNKTKEMHNMTFTKSKNYLNKSINNHYNSDIKVKKTINYSSSKSPRKTRKSETKSPNKVSSAEKTIPSSPPKRPITFNRVASKPSFKNYTGPIDLSCIINLEPNDLLKKINTILKKNKLVYFNSFKKYQCNKNGIKFLIEVMTLRDSNISYVKLKKIQGSNYDYNQLISKLLKEFRIFK